VKDGAEGEILGQAEIDRLWQHRQSVDTHFNDRLNFFVVFESVLLGVVGVLGDRQVISRDALRLVAALGALLTVLWWYAQSKQRYILNLLRIRAAQFMPEYKATRSLRTSRLYQVSVTWVLAHLLPALFGAIWLILITSI
jgi:hypothetical protein